jgi:hypothetical protein
MHTTTKTPSFRSRALAPPRGAGRFAAMLSVAAFWLAMLASASAQAPAHVFLERDPAAGWTLTTPTASGSSTCRAPCDVALPAGTYVIAGRMGPDHERVTLAPGDDLTLAIDRRPTEDRALVALLTFAGFSIGTAVTGLFIAIGDPQATDVGVGIITTALTVGALGVTLSVFLMPTGTPRVTLTPAR